MQSSSYRCNSIGNQKPTGVHLLHKFGAVARKRWAKKKKKREREMDRVHPLLISIAEALFNSGKC